MMWIDRLVASKAWRVYGPWVLPRLSVISDTCLTVIAIAWPFVGFFFLLLNPATTPDRQVLYASFVASFWSFPFVSGACFVARICAEEEEIGPKHFFIRLAPIFTAVWFVLSVLRL
ncbi:MAG TPA: hypothetical protein VFP50_19305 [Anaeromyxobacteraceae bacterium]|nr:hypothetical protein [Anaeromyxobacteraceae bacterium]